MFTPICLSIVVRFLHLLLTTQLTFTYREILITKLQLPSSTLENTWHTVIKVINLCLVNTNKKHVKLSIAAIKKVIQEYHTRISDLEDKKFDIEYIVKKKDFEVRVILVLIFGSTLTTAITIRICYTG